MEYMLTLNFTTRELAQLWIEETFDLSAVTIKGIWPSPFRGQVFAKIETIIAQEAKGSFEDGLSRLRNVYPESGRKVLYWEAVKD